MTPTGPGNPGDDDSTVDATSQLERVRQRAGLLRAGHAALQWAQLAAWLLELHEDVRAPSGALRRAALHMDLVGGGAAAGTPMPDARQMLEGELATLDELRRGWCAPPPLGAARAKRLDPSRRAARVAALDAVRRGLMAALDVFGGEASERDAGVRETIALTFAAWRAYAGSVDPNVASMMDGFAKMLGSMSVAAVAVREEGDHAKR